MKKLRLRKWVKYLLLGIANTLLLINLPMIIRQVNTINDYRYNILAIATIIIINSVAILKIEN